MDRGDWWAIYSPWDCKEWNMTERLNILGPRLGGEYGCVCVCVCRFGQGVFVV